MPGPRRSRQPRTVKEKGQAIVILAVIFVVLLGFVGLAIDLGRIYVAIGSLRRAVDAASLGAASQFREGRGIDEMTAMATQILNMNGITPTSILVEDCPHAVVPNDPVLCVTPHRKYVRVTASASVPMTFLRVIHIDQITLSSNAVSEAASLDVVLVIDISESMAQTSDGKQADPSQCNPTQTCQPFEKVREAANTFVDRILDLPPAQESDRIAIVYFSNGWQSDPNKFPYGLHNGATDVISPGWITDNSTAHAAVNNLAVYQATDCINNPTYGTCLSHDASGHFIGINCPIFDNGTDPSSCTTTNTGGALRLAGNMFATNSRPEALWVVVLLSDGAVNASDATTGHSFGYCPNSDWSPPFCRDRLTSTYLLPTGAHHTHTTLQYDADDYARDSADFVGCYQKNTAAACSTAGQGALIFTIGLGSQVLTTYSPDAVPHGVAFLRYAAAVGDDGDPATDQCAGYYGNLAGWQSNCGNYYFDATGDKLIAVFEDIASRIFTRITR
jgi:Flp pilus assembly protein TadG